MVLGYSGFWEGIGDSLGFIPHHKEERGLTMGVMFPVIVDKLCHGKVLCPFSRGGSAINV